MAEFINDIAEVEIEIAENVKTFLESTTGKLIIARGEYDTERAAEDLLTLNPYEFHSLSALQARISGIQRKYEIFKNIEQYLSDAIINGDNAFQAIQEYDE